MSEPAYPLRPLAALLAFAIFTWCAAPAGAQQTRAEVIAQQQAERSKHLVPNVESGAEKTLEWFEHYFTDPNLLYVTFGNVYPTGGLAPGIAWRRAMGHARLNIGAAWSLRSYKRVHALLRFPELAGDTIEVETHARWIDATQVPFYGLGNDTIRAGAASYGFRSTDIGGSFAYKPVRWFRIGAGVASRRQDDRGGVGTWPPIDERFAPATAPGLFTDPRYIQSTASASIDWRESAGYTRRGGWYYVTFNDFRDADDELSFRRIDAELRQFIPILNEHWVLGFRGLVQTTDTDEGQTVPYYLLPSLGGNDSLRAYPDFRFQDRHLLLLGAEYRWLPSRIIDMALFVDAGKVAATRSDLDTNDLKTGYGVGIRFHGPTFTPLRVDVAHGDEGFRVHFTGSVGF